jgi:hypothetical protein
VVDEREDESRALTGEDGPTFIVTEPARTFRGTDAGHVNSDVESEAGDDFRQSSPRVKRRPRPAFRRFERKVTVDDALFTTVRIDGFKQPFGGFAPSAKDMFLDGQAADVPMIRVRTLRRKEVLVQSAPRAALVRPTGRNGPPHTKGHATF